MNGKADRSKDNGASSYRRFLDGDENGFVEIVRDYKDGLIFYINGIVGDLPTAEEIAEDTFVRLGLKKPRDRGNASFKTWLYTIGRNLAIDYLRKKSKGRTVPLDGYEELGGGETPEEAYLGDERKIALHRAMKGLKNEYRQVLYLIYFGNFSIKDAARIMKKSVHGTETLVYRARQSLKKELMKEESFK